MRRADVPAFAIMFNVGTVLKPATPIRIFSTLYDDIEDPAFKECFVHELPQSRGQRVKTEKIDIKQGLESIDIDNLLEDVYEVFVYSGPELEACF